MKVPSIAELALRIRSNQLTIPDLVGICLKRIDEVDSEIKAWVAVDSQHAMQEAYRLQNELHAGQDRGLLHGIPMGIKDIIDVAGYPTMAGTDWRVDVCTQHAPLVQNLEEAGAVILGKTVTTQFAGFDPSVTRNPAAPERTPGATVPGRAPCHPPTTRSGSEAPWNGFPFHPKPQWGHQLEPDRPPRRAGFGCACTQRCDCQGVEY